MKRSLFVRRVLSPLVFGGAALLALPGVNAALTSLADTPLANSPSTSVLPNMMFILDDSGSMAWNYMPDFVHTNSAGTTFANCRVCTSSSCNGPGGTGSNGSSCGAAGKHANTELTGGTPDYGEAPFYANAFNRIWYNPDITYAPAVDSTGTSLGASVPTAAKNDGFGILATGTTNLTNAFKEVIYCNVNNPNASALTDTSKCRYQGRHNVSPFVAGTTYFLLGQSSGTNAGYPTTAFFSKNVVNSVPHYYNITPNEYCSDVNLVTCALATAAGAPPNATSNIPAPVRWCATAADAIATTVVSGNSGGNPRCRKKFDQGAGYVYPRFGRFTRVDIVPTTTSYPKSATSTRTDCAAAASCTYAEELQNFANWYSYYRFRLTLMKTSAGRAFLSIDDRFKVGFITINPNSPVTNDKFVPVKKFDAAQRSAFYTTMYAQDTNGSTPLREALSRVGRYYAGVSSGISSGMINAPTKPDPVEFSCQTNYALLTTDGYWNGNAGQTTTGGAIGNQDNTNSGFTTRTVGAYDGGIAGASDTLADVAAYYYKTDLRTAGAVSLNNVPTNDKDTNNAQHMVTFTLGLGLEGFMDYRSDYETASVGDFAKIKAGTNNACSWTSGTCNWPAPSANQPSTLDDLWHAAVNGRGSYFSASDPNSLAQGLQSALAQLRVATAAAAASATSSPNITQTDNFIYSSTFRTGKWDGEITAQRVDPVTGNVLSTVVWTAQDQLDTKAAAGSRQIFTIDEGAGGRRKPFLFANLSSTTVGGIAPEQSYFLNKCGVLSQCTLLTAAQKVIANDGTSLVNYLRGDRTFETFTPPGETEPVFRLRDHVLGDPVNATPAFVKAPQFDFTDAVTPTYASFQIANQGRQGMLYIAANDGMLHALNGDTGDEVWAYVPRIVMPRLAKIATDNWSATHQFSVDGSPQVMDVFLSGAWRTILVAGLNSGGRGFYALDITVPSAPTVLWEVCSDATICRNSDADMGYSFGNPLITKRKADGKWVVFVTSGMNNVSPGDGKGYLYTIDIATGQIISKVGTGVGSTTTPSGLNHIAGFADNFAIDNTARLIYGGDLEGNVWKFDTSSTNPTVTKLAGLFDAGGKPQSITARPELALIDGFPVVYVGTGRYLGTDDLVDPATLGLPYAYQQSLYAIKDRGVTYANFRNANVVQNTIIDNGTTRTTTNNTVDWAVNDGWFLDFNPGNTTPGERVNLDPQLVQGTLVVVTNIPNNGACTIGGDSFIYQFNYKSGTYVQSAAGQVAGTKFTGQITVGVVVVRLPSGVFKGIATGASGTKTPFPINIGGGSGNARRISWRELIRR